LVQAVRGCLEKDLPVELTEIRPLSRVVVAVALLPLVQMVQDHSVVLAGQEQIGNLLGRFTLAVAVAVAHNKARQEGLLEVGALETVGITGLLDLRLLLIPAAVVEVVETLI